MFRSDSDVFVFLDNQLIVEIAGIRSVPETKRIPMSTLTFTPSQLYVSGLFHYFCMTSSYTIRVFFASRQAYPATFSIHTDFEQLCYIPDFLSVNTLHNEYPNDGQIK